MGSESGTMVPHNWPVRSRGLGRVCSGSSSVEQEMGLEEGTGQESCLSGNRVGCLDNWGSNSLPTPSETAETGKAPLAST